MCFQLNVIKPENAAFIEQTIPLRDRVAITCTNKDDMNVLIRMFRDTQKLGVNIVYSDPQEGVHIYQPQIPIERLRKFGLHAYLLSLLTGPPPLITYLCKTYRIHNTPVGDEKTNQCFEAIPQEISSFFSGMYNLVRKYQSDFSI